MLEMTSVRSARSECSLPQVGGRGRRREEPGDDLLGLPLRQQPDRLIRVDQPGLSDAAPVRIAELPAPGVSRATAASGLVHLGQPGRGRSWISVINAFLYSSIGGISGSAMSICNL